jgi:hypothetical protein
MLGKVGVGETLIYKQYRLYSQHSILFVTNGSDKIEYYITLGWKGLPIKTLYFI